MLKIERQKIIHEKLLNSGSILISDISQILNCSEETVRRDLREMESKYKIIRTHGGAYLPDQEDKGIPTKLKETLRAEEKNTVASLATETFIRENDTIILDSSTTCVVLAKHLLALNIPITIITNSSRILTLFDSKCSNVKLICIGGIYRPRSYSFVGHQAIDSINHYVADKCFISSAAADLEFGLLDNNINESEVRKAFMKHSRERYFIADHTKFSDRADYILCPLDQLNAIITDRPLNLQWTEKAKSLGISIFSPDNNLSLDCKEN